MYCILCISIYYMPALKPRRYSILVNVKELNRAIEHRFHKDIGNYDISLAVRPVIQSVEAHFLCLLSAFCSEHLAVAHRAPLLMTGINCDHIRGPASSQHFQLCMRLLLVLWLDLLPLPWYLSKTIQLIYCSLHRFLYINFRLNCLYFIWTQKNNVH